MMKMTRRQVGVYAGLMAAVASMVGSHVHALVASEGPAYVVQVHTSREGFVLPERSDAAAWRSQVMTMASGQQFECYLPPLSTGNRSDAGEEEKAAEDAQDAGHLLAFARAAVKRVRPKCVTVTPQQHPWRYELCPGIMLRRAMVKGEDDVAEPKQAQDELTGSKTNEKVHEAEELAEFTMDGTEPLLEYDMPVDEHAEERLKIQQKSLYTQTYRAKSSSTEDIKLQFLCGAQTQEESQVIAVRSAQDGTPSAFVIASRVFCDTTQANATGDQKFTVESLLRPLAETHTCIKRNEGWWTYEFCFGHDIRQYHRDSNGHVASGFSLGAYDADANAQLDASGETLVSEYIDATRDVLRPAFVEVYSGGTHCKEIGVSMPRESKVYYYCNPNGASNHILSVKETQTCTYTIKIASPVVCDHPHFVRSETSTQDKVEILHCIPLSSQAPTASAMATPVTETETEAEAAEV